MELEELDKLLDEAWDVTNRIPGFLTENEARFLGIAAVCSGRTGAIVEIGSFKGKSTVMLATVAKRLGLSRVTAIDPHNFNSAELHQYKAGADSTTFSEFVDNLQRAGVSDYVDIRRNYSSEVASGWSSPIGFLWIDGDHSYKGAKEDFDGFFPHLLPKGIVAFHDALHEFSGPIRVFVEDILRSDRFGPSGFVGSVAWSQFRPDDGHTFRSQRVALGKIASPLIPLVREEKKLRGVRKLLYKILRSRVPRGPIALDQWAASMCIQG